MTAHHPAQRELAITIAKLETARKRAKELGETRTALEAKAHDRALAMAESQCALRRAAGAHASGEGDERTVTAARKSYAAARVEAETAELEAEGVAERVVAAEAEAEQLERRVSEIAADVAVLANDEIEREAAALARRLGVLMTRHRELYSFACSQASSAAGHWVDPIPTMGDGHTTIFAHEIKELLAKRPQSTPSIDDMLEIPLSSPIAVAA